MARVIFISIFIQSIFCCNIFAQKDSLINLTEKQFLQGNFTNFYVDNLNNVYLINANNQIKKLNDKGDSVAVSNALKKYGDIWNMDIR